MRPLTLHLENARTFDILDFEFADGAYAILGPNGAGKSTLISAIDVALFGAEGRSLSDWLTKDRLDATMLIQLVFDHDGTTYRIGRSYDGRGRGTSRLTFEQHLFSGANGPSDAPGGWDLLNRESTSATQEAIEETIGLTRETFRASAFAPQEQAGIFCNAQPRERKQILASVLGLGVWDGYRERARTDLRAAEQSLAVVRAKIEQAETELAERTGLALLAEQAKDNESTARTALEDCRSQLAKARERLSKLREAAVVRDAAVRARDAAEASHASLLDRIAGLERQIQESETRLGEREGLETLAEGLPGLEAEQRVLAGEVEDYAERDRLVKERKRLFDETADLIARAEGLAAKALAAAENTETEVCGLCQRPLDQASARAVVASYKAQADDLGDKATATAREADALTVKIDARPNVAPDAERVRQVADLIRLGRAAQQKLAALTEVSQAVTYLRADLKELRSEEPEVKQRADAASDELTALGPHDSVEIQTAERLVATHEAGEREAQRQVSEREQEIARLDERLARLDKLAADTKTAQDDRDAWQSEVELLSHMERACGPNGVPALILETSAIPQLEAEWNRLLRLLPTESGDLFEVELHTQREKKSGEGAVDALDIIVYANGTARPYSTYSGGERMRIDIAQRRALSNLLAHRKGAECPLMILDEPNSLDDQGMAALAQILEDLAAAEGLTILVVSHDPALRDAFERSIQIEKIDGRSRIVSAAEPVLTVQEVV